MSPTKRTKIIRYHIENPNNSLSDIMEYFKEPRSTISDIISKHFNIARKLFVVRSECESDTFFVFNGITERKFTLDRFGYVQERYLFNQSEKNILKNNGFYI